MDNYYSYFNRNYVSFFSLAKKYRSDKIDMLRLAENKLIKLNEKYFYQNKPYNGIIFFISDCFITDKKIVENGKIVSSYINPYLDYSKYTKEVLSKCLYEGISDEEFWFDSKLFTGISHHFENGIQMYEWCYRKGFLPNTHLGTNDINLTRIGYDEYGNIIDFESNDGEIIQEFDFHNTHDIYISNRTNYQLKNENYHFEISIKSKKIINILSIEGNFFDNLEFIKKRIKFDIFNSKSFLLNMIANEEYISLSDSGIDDEIFYYLYLNNGLDNTKRIYITNTSLTEKSLLLLDRKVNLKEIRITTNNLGLKEILKNIKSNNLRYKIFFNEREITL